MVCPTHIQIGCSIVVSGRGPGYRQPRNYFQRLETVTKSSSKEIASTCRLVQPTLRIYSQSVEIITQYFPQLVYVFPAAYASLWGLTYISASRCMTVGLPSFESVKSWLRTQTTRVACLTEIAARSTKATRTSTAGRHYRPLAEEC